MKRGGFPDREIVGTMFRFPVEHCRLLWLGKGSQGENGH